MELDIENLRIAVANMKFNILDIGDHLTEMMTVYTPAQLKALTKKRELFEKEIDHPASIQVIQSLDAYITFENEIWEVIIQKNIEQPCNAKTALMEVMKNRIKRLYDFAYQMSNNEQNLRKEFEKVCFLNYLKCEKSNNYHHGIICIEMLILTNKFKAHYWLKAARFINRNQNTDLAIDMLVRSLNIYKDEPDLYKELFKLKLSTITNYNNPEVDISQYESQVLELFQNTIKIMFEYMKDTDEKFKQLLFDLLEMLQPYSFTEEIQETLVKKIVGSPCKDDEWIKLIQYLKKQQPDIDSQMNRISAWLDCHETTTVLHTALMELKLSKISILSREETGEPELKQLQEQCCAEITTYVTAVLNTVNDYHFLIKLLELLPAYEFTKNLQEKIITKLIATFSHEEMVWHYLAQRERQGLHTTNCKTLDEAGLSVNEPKDILDCCIQKYEKGLRKVPPEKKQNLWAMYLDTLLEMDRGDRTNIDVVALKTAIKAAFRTAISEGCVTEPQFKEWFKYLSDQELKEAHTAATDAFPQSKSLWYTRLQAVQLPDDVDEEYLHEVFEEGVRALKENALSLWSLLVRHYLIQFAMENHPREYVVGMIKKIFEASIKEPDEVAITMKEQYFGWYSREFKTRCLRDLYVQIGKTKPYVKYVHDTMIRFEKLERPVKPNSIDVCYQNMCAQFGEDIQVWKDYIEFAILYRRATNTILRQAAKKLTPAAYERLIVWCKSEKKIEVEFKPSTSEPSSTSGTSSQSQAYSETVTSKSSASETASTSGTSSQSQAHSETVTSKSSTLESSSTSETSSKSQAHSGTVTSKPIAPETGSSSRTSETSPKATQ